MQAMPQDILWILVFHYQRCYKILVGSIILSG